MERKTKQRILGMFVVIGLVIILLPFLQGEKESPAETMLVKAPPFPDQSVQINAAPTQVAMQQQPAPTAQPVAAVSSPNTLHQPDESIQTHTVAKTSIEHNTNQVSIDTNKEPVAATDIWSEEEQQQKEVEQAKSNKPMMANVEATTAIKKPEQSLASLTKTAVETPTQMAQSIPVSEKAIPKVAKHINTVKLKPLPAVRRSVNENGLFSLKNAAWVIQVGSFKNKTNALRLVNQLRANGYKAFIQQMSAPDGSNVRVFIGPEPKQISARALATRLENEMRIRGIVISYKPLAM